MKQQTEIIERELDINKPIIAYCPNCYFGYDYIKYRCCPKCKQEHK